MIRWVDITALATARFKNAHDFARATQISYPSARRLFIGDVPSVLQRIDVDVLESLAKALDVKPWQLLDWGEWGSPDKPEKKKKKR